MQDIRVGGREAFAQYQYTLQSDDLHQLYEWGPRITAALEQLPELTDVNSDQQQGGLETRLAIDRATAARLGVTARQIDNTLYDAFGERVVSTIYTPRNQYKVVMEVFAAILADPRYAEQDFCQHRRRDQGDAGDKRACGHRYPAAGSPGAARSTRGRCAGGAQSGDECDRE